MHRVRKWLQSTVFAVLSAAALTAAPGHADPTITGIVPPQAPLQGFVKIEGSGFGVAQGTGYVILGGQWLPVVGWTDGAIHVAVNPQAFRQPPLALNTPYPMQVVLPSGSHVSNTMDFTIIPGTPPPYPNVLGPSPSSQPAFASFNGPLYCPGDVLAVNGSGFGDSQGSGYVTITAPFLDASNNPFTEVVQVPVLAWSDSVVTIVVSSPGGALPGNYIVTVHRGNGNSTSAQFVVGSRVNGTCLAPVPTATLNPPSADFGSVAVGSSSTRSFTLMNPGPAALHISSVTFNGAAQTIFHFVSGDGGGFLAPGSSRTITVAFSPQIGANTPYSASFSVIADGIVSPSAATLTGTGTAGTPAVGLSSTIVHFGMVPLHHMVTQTVTLTNTGTGTLTLINVTRAGSTSVDFNPSGPPGMPTLTPGQSLTITITYTPNTSGGGFHSGTVYVVTNASSSPDPISVDGTGF